MAYIKAWETDSRYASPLSHAQIASSPIVGSPFLRWGGGKVYPEGARVPWPRVAGARGRYMCARSSSVRVHLQMFSRGPACEF